MEEKDYLSPGLQTVYLDPDTIRREGNLVTLWQLIDCKTMQGNAGMGPFGFGRSDRAVLERLGGIIERGQRVAKGTTH